MPTMSNADCHKQFPTGNECTASVTIQMGQGEQFISVICSIWPSSGAPPKNDSPAMSLIGRQYVTSAAYVPAGTSAPWSYEFTLTYQAANGNIMTMTYPIPPGTVGPPP